MEHSYLKVTANDEISCPYSGHIPRKQSDAMSDGSRTASPSSSHKQKSSYSSPPTSDHDGRTSSEATCPVVFTQEVDPLLLRKSLEDRVAYLTDFLGFTSDDSDMITKVAPYVNDIIPEMVDDMYAKLFEFDITKKVFMNRNQGFDGPLPNRLEDLTLDSPQIKFRKVFMKSWARRVLTSDYTTGKTWAYMDKVGIMHTGVSPFKHQRTMGIKPLNVPYRDIALTMGWIQSILQTALLQVPDSQLSMADKIAAITAINKVMWIQNDLFSRHYIDEQ
ncbi:hypothetical protein OE88DRAFT_1665207 [Heliocybe sulcata]|uniref:Globin-sensor domain-containing protein n=1 Tax=Heliocybe sulcata TaxID=5364 RepID=A0A5C3MSZ2_9AGAM|nr:hypothetical protein OE88DRAFT_1665207 [Heliocybe sulcata]